MTGHFPRAGPPVILIQKTFYFCLNGILCAISPHKRNTTSSWSIVHRTPVVVSLRLLGDMKSLIQDLFVTGWTSGMGQPPHSKRSRARAGLRLSRDHGLIESSDQKLVAQIAWNEVSSTPKFVSEFAKTQAFKCLKELFVAGVDRWATNTSAPSHAQLMSVSHYQAFPAVSLFALFI